MDQHLTIATDGACAGNQHPSKRRSGYGFLVEADDEIVHEESGALLKGEDATNNRAEYDAVIRALEWVTSNYTAKSTGVSVFSDSELMIKQVSGEYSTNPTHLKRRRDRVRSLTNEFAWYDLAYRSIEECDLIRRADELAVIGTDQY